MIAELGQFALALALAIALVSAVFGFWHIRRQTLGSAYLARALAGSTWITFALTAAAFGALIWCQRVVGEDFPEIGIGLCLEAC